MQNSYTKLQKLYEYAILKLPNNFISHGIRIQIDILYLFFRMQWKIVGRQSEILMQGVSSVVDTPFFHKKAHILIANFALL